MTEWKEIEIPSFKDAYGDFGHYLLVKLRDGQTLSNDECTAQLKSKGFASATKIIKDTNRTKTVVTALHIPNASGQIHHYDITLYRYRRDKSSDTKDWQLQRDFSLREEEVCAFYDFLSDQNQFIGKSFSDKFATVIYSAQEINTKDIQNVRSLIRNLSTEQLEQIVASDVGVEAITKSLPRLRIDLLERLIIDLKSLLEKSEKDVQNWIDDDPKVHCLIFGLEYIDYKRETPFGNSQFDILTDISGTEHVIIELKSPNKPLFQIIERKLKNGVKKDYALSPDLAEAIPQTIKYFRDYDRESKETFIKNGTEQKKVPKAIIIIGRNIKDDSVWQDHYCDLRNRIAGIEVLTYDHLIEKLQNQITNLKKLDL